LQGKGPKSDSGVARVFPVLEQRTSLQAVATADLSRAGWLKIAPGCSGAYVPGTGLALSHSRVSLSSGLIWVECCQSGIFSFNFASPLAITVH